MPKRSERGKKRKFRRRASGKAKPYFAEGKSGKNCCALCGAVLHGTPHGKSASAVRQLGKSERRPSALFAGTLCGKCRTLVVEEAAKVDCKAKKLADVELRLQPYVACVKVS